MTPILDAIRLALSSIWANKLRSFMMVLGNIVAVTSIIAVVSLIQGMDSYVSNAILRDVGRRHLQDREDRVHHRRGGGAARVAA